MNARDNARRDASRPSCYLCETPKMPWSVIDSLPNLPEGNVVCRSCVNFEGVDRLVRILRIMKLTKKRKKECFI